MINEIIQISHIVHQKSLLPDNYSQLNINKTSFIVIITIEEKRQKNYFFTLDSLISIATIHYIKCQLFAIAVLLLNAV